MPRSFLWFTLTIGLCVIAIVVLAVLTYHNASLAKQTEAQLEHSTAIKLAAMETLSFVKDAETGQRGFLITGSQDYLKPYFTGTAGVDAKLMTLRELLAGRPNTSEVITELKRLIDAKEDDMAETIELRQDIQGEVGYQKAREVVRTHRGRNTMRAIRNYVDQIVLEENKITKAIRKDSKRRAATSKSMIVLGNVLAISLLAAAAFAAYIDRQKRTDAEKQMEAVATELEAIMDSVKDGIVAFDDELRFRFMNPAAANIHKCDRRVIIGQSILQFVPQRNRDLAEETIIGFIRSGEPSMTFEDGLAQRSDGEEFPCEGTLTRTFAGGHSFTTHMFQDLSDVVAGRAAILERNALLDQSRDAIYVCDMDDRITYWNHAADALFGITADEALGQSVVELLFANRPDDWLDGRGRLMNEGNYSIERNHLSRDGREIVLEQRCSLIRAGDSAPSAQLVINFDVTERKKTQRLERRSQRLESIGTLAGGIAHDLNNVLTPVLMSGKLLRKNDANRERLANAIVTSAERGGEMIKKLLSFAGGTMALSETVALDEIVEETRSILEHTLPKTIELVVHTAVSVPPIRGDATELTQVLMNLAINARDAMPDGGRLEIAVDNFYVDQRRADRNPQLEPGKHVTITVTDTGTGIPADNLDRIFDPFFTTKEQGKGTGLGLATTLGIVRGHGGDVDVYSEPAVGTKFTIFLPIAKLTDRQNRVVENGDGELLQGEGEVVLLVDDEPLILETAQVTLEANGYKVKIANGGVQAVATYQHAAEQIDLVVLDMMMPGMDGLETRRALRTIEPDVRIIACSGLRRPDSKEQDSVDGVDVFLAKPYSDEQLLRAVRRVLNQPEEAMKVEN